jgi:membrane associated rhomboid family serine protease
LRLLNFLMPLKGNCTQMDADGMDNISQDSEKCVISAADPQTALEWCAVLESQNIDFTLRRGGSVENDEWVFELPLELCRRAEREIREYESERAFFLQFKRLSNEPPKPLRLAPALPMMAFTAILALFHLFIASTDGKTAWFAAGELTTASPEISQWWRPITALTLHADAPHILGNAVFAVFFGGMLALEIGGGAVLAVAVASGVLGNLSSLWFNLDRGYSAIGFSTAVFGLLGAMAALRTHAQLPSEKKFALRYWLPLGAAVALLAMTGSGPGSDLTGHLFGFFWGFVIGWFSAKLAENRDAPVLQLVSAAFAALAVIAAWAAAIANATPPK